MSLWCNCLSTDAIKSNLNTDAMKSNSSTDVINQIEAKTDVKIEFLCQANYETNRMELFPRAEKFTGLLKTAAGRFFSNCVRCRCASIFFI